MASVNNQKIYHLNLLLNRILALIKTKHFTLNFLNISLSCWFWKIFSIYYPCDISLTIFITILCYLHWTPGVSPTHTCTCFHIFARFLQYVYLGPQGFNKQKGSMPSTKLSLNPAFLIPIPSQCCPCLVSDWLNLSNVWWFPCANWMLPCALVICSIPNDFPLPLWYALYPVISACWLGLVHDMFQYVLIWDIIHAIVHYSLQYYAAKYMQVDI